MTFAEEPRGSSETPSPQTAKKIIVDEDWKSQVEAEKQAAAAQQPAGASASQASPSTPVDSPEPSPPQAASARSAQPAMPPADLSMLVSMLAAQAMVTLGALPNPLTGKATANLPEARHFIDLIDVLEQKTRGNTTPQEATMLKGLLHELRMAYVSAENELGGPPPE